MTDTIVVGGGTAGAVMAARLSEDPDRHVTLLEEGPDDATYDGRVRDPRRVIELFADTAHSTVFTMDGDHPMPMVRGRGLGGTSIVNHLLAMRGHPDDYAGWGVPWSTIEALFERAEAQLGVRPWSRDELSPVATAFVDGIDGARVCSAARHADGSRRTVSEAYLTPEVRARANLTIRTGARVERLDELDAPEIVVCCGATQTPALLQRSGIACGEGLQDHLGLGVAYTHPGRSQAPGQVLLATDDTHLIPIALPGDGDTTIAMALAFVLDLDDRGRVDGERVVAQRRDERDVERLAATLARLAAWESSDAFARLGLARLGPVPDPATAPLTSYGHQAATCAIGTVLDEHCRVLAAPHVRVVDASSLPLVPHATPYLSVVVLAEHVAALMQD